MEKELEAAFPQACTVTGQDAMATSWGRCLCMQGDFQWGINQTLEWAAQEVVELPTPEVFKIQLDKGLGSAFKGPAFSKSLS